MSGHDEAPEDRSNVLEWFTQARRIPQLIGKLPSGERIKGGPYRPIQLIIFGAVLVAGHASMPWWSGVGGGGFYGMGVRYLIVGGLAVAATIAARQIPLTMVNPLLVLDGGVRQALRGSRVQWAGQAVTPPQAYQTRTSRVVVQPLPATSDSLDLVAAEPAAAPAGGLPSRDWAHLPAYGPPRASAESKMSELLQEKR